MLLLLSEHLGERGASPGSALVPPLLLTALTSPSQDGNLLRLETGGREFLVVTGPGGATPEAIWLAAVAVAASYADGPPPAGGRHVARLGYRAFPDGLRAVGVHVAGESLAAWVSASLPAAEQRAAVRMLARAEPGYHRLLPAALPLALLARHPGRVALSAAGTAAGAVATVTGLQMATLPPPRYGAAEGAAPAVVPVSSLRHSPALPPPRPGRHHPAAPQEARQPRSVPTPTALPSPPAPSPSPTVPPQPGRICVRVLRVKVCAKVRA